MGLGASVWTSDWQKGVLPSPQRLESGTAWVNRVFTTHPHAPFGGVKDSGVGREGGVWGFAGASELQTLSIAKKIESLVSPCSFHPVNAFQRRTVPEKRIFSWR